MAGVKVTDSQIKKIIEGFGGIEKDFNRINRQLNKRLPKKLLNLLRKKTPKDTGKTSRSWRTVSLGSNGFSIQNDNGGILEFLMSGVKPHKIEASTSVLKIELPGSVIFARFANHPGYRKQMDRDEFMNDIMVLLNEEINLIVTEIINKRLEKF